MYMQVYQCPLCGESVEDNEFRREEHTQQCLGLKELARRITHNLKIMEDKNATRDEWGRTEANGSL
jgi:hypothetical protein